MTSRILISIVFIFLSCSLLSQSQDKNYIRHKTIWKSVTDENIINNNGLEDNELQENIVYFDGLGRELQEITVRKSPGNNDIIVPYKYDKFNHQSETFLPFTFQNDGNYLSSVYYKQKQFYSNPPENVIQSQYPVAKALYESSPLNRILEQGNVGEAWKLENGATTKYNYMTNSDGDARKWYFIYGGDGYCTSNEHYGEGELIKTEVIDENGNISCEYKDKSGKIVMKEASIGEEKAKTYYVYDDFGSLRYVIQPGVLSLGGLFTHFKWAFKYTYDNRKLLVEKMMPGMNEPQYMVYDSLYRLVLFQDGNMRLKDEKLWKFIKYDIFSRPVLEGFYTHSSVLDRQQMQEYVDNWIFSGGSFYEERTSGNYEVQQGYTDQAFPPLSNCEILKVYYYNHYDFDLNGYNNYDYEPDDINFPDNEWSDRNKGLLTGMKVRIMDKQWPDESWIVNVIFYDKYQRVIQEFRNHHTDGHLIVTNSFLFNSNIINKTKTYLFQPIEQEIITEYIFDHARRPVEIKQSLNGNNFITIAELKYNELGELVEKNLHKNPVTGNYLQSIDFTYNIRGWLTHINNPEIGGGDGDLFGMELIYDKGFDILNAEPQFNGNISAQKWSASNPNGEPVFNAYGYNYDALNRLTNANYAASRDGIDWSLYLNGYTVDIAFQDMNGNIASINRRGPTTVWDQFDQIDQLQYYYDANRIIGVNDGIDNVQCLIKNFEDNGFEFNPEDPVNTQEYFYDPNGNMIQDLNKGIQNITYNHLNLPEQIDITGNRSITYLYDADGNKLRKTVENQYGITTTEYIGNFVFVNDQLDHIINEEGLIKCIQESGGESLMSFEHEYFIKDHLGNTRIHFKDDGNGNAMMLQQNHYYPFGMNATINYVSGDAVPDGDPNKYLYNGKELQDENGLDWYDYGARFYDAQLGRWPVIDKMAQSYDNYSPYNYALNNPINAIDSDGQLVIFVNGFILNQFLKQDNRRYLFRRECYPFVYENPNYRPYPPERAFTRVAPQYQGRSFTYWGNESDEKAGVGGLFSQVYDDYNTLFISSTTNNNSKAQDRFSEGVMAAGDLITKLESGEISLNDGETIKIIAHSHGAAFAAGMASVLYKNQKYSAILEAIHYIAPHQPGDFKHPSNVEGHQWSTKTDWISSKWTPIMWLNGGSTLEKIPGVSINNYHIRDSYLGGRGGHSIETYLNYLINYWRSLGIIVNVIE